MDVEMIKVKDPPYLLNEILRMDNTLVIIECLLQKYQNSIKKINKLEQGGLIKFTSVKEYDLVWLLNRVKSKVNRLFITNCSLSPKIRYANYNDVLYSYEVSSFMILGFKLYLIYFLSFILFYNSPILSIIIPFFSIMILFFCYKLKILVDTLLKNYIDVYSCNSEEKFLQNKEGKTYCLFSEIIINPYSKMEETIPAIAHEYTHHLQYLKVLLRYHHSDNDLILAWMEGLARFAERAIADLFCSKENNCAYICHCVRRCFLELQSVYIYCCLYKGIEINQSLCCFDLFEEDIEYSIMVRDGFPSHYAIGNTYFMIREFVATKYENYLDEFYILCLMINLQRGGYENESDTD